ncbi:MAG: alginate export family protein [Candidatus Zixiibacteriota bacterium]
MPVRRPYDLLAAIALAATIFGIARPVPAEDIRWEFSAQVRPRLEIRDGYRRPLMRDEGPVLLLSQRTRLGIRCIVNPQVTAFVQFQDARTWGDEGSQAWGTRSSVALLDTYRAFIELRWRHWSLRCGRQELTCEEERIMGSSDWLQQARAHDAICLQWQRGHWTGQTAWAHNESGQPLTSDYSIYIENGNWDYKSLAMWWISHQTRRWKESFFLLYDHDWEMRDMLGYTSRFSFGPRFESALERFGLRLEAHWQLGRLKRSTWYYPGPSIADTLDVNAFMVASSVTYDLGAVKLGLWYDYLSGNRSDSSAYRAFDAPYPSNHEFYGWADYFEDIPNDTRQRGLQDLALKITIRNIGPVSGQCDLHYFWFAQPDEKRDKALGMEIDIGATFPLMKSVALSAGYAHVVPTEALKREGRRDRGELVLFDA